MTRIRQVLAAQGLAQVWRLFICSSGAQREIYLFFLQHVEQHADMMLQPTPLLSPAATGSDGGVFAGFNPAHGHHPRMLSQLHMLQSMQFQLPRYWTRFGSRHMPEIINKTLLLLLGHGSAGGTAPTQGAGDVGGGSGSGGGSGVGGNSGSSASVAATLETIDCFSFFDPQAKWFFKWMEGEYSRQHIFACFDKNPELLAAVMKRYLQLLDAMQHATEMHSKKPVEIDGAGEAGLDGKAGTRTGTPYTAAETNQLRAVYATSILVLVVQYKRGRECFPLVIDGLAFDAANRVGLANASVDSVASAASVDNADSSSDGNVNPIKVGVADFVRLLVQMISFPPSPHNTPNSSVGRYSIQTIAADALKTIAKQSSATRCLLLDTVVFSNLLAPLRRLSGANNATQTAGDTLGTSDLCMGSLDAGVVHACRHSAAILSALAGSNESRNRMLEKGICSSSSSSSTVSGASECVQAVADAVLHMFNVGLSSADGVAARKAGENQGGAMSLVLDLLVLCRQLYGTHEGLGQLLPFRIEQQLLQQHHAHPSLTRHPAWEHASLHCLLGLACTPRGLQALVGLGDATVQQCGAWVFQQVASQQQVGEHEHFGYGRLLAQFAATPAGMLALHDAGAVRHFLKELFQTMHYGVDFGPQEFVEDSSSSSSSASAMEKALSYCVKLFASHAAVRTLLAAEAAAASAGRGGGGGGGSCGGKRASNGGRTSDSSNGNAAAESVFQVGSFGSTLTDVVKVALQTPGCASVPHQLDAELFHVAALRLLLAICSSMDGIVLLEHRFAISARLLELLADTDLDDSVGSTDAGVGAGGAGGASAGSRSRLVLEPIRLLRTRLFLLVHAVAGPTERVLPPASLNDAGPCTVAVGEVVLFSELPVPVVYQARKPLAAPAVAATSAIATGGATMIRSLQKQAALRSDGSGSTLAGLQAYVLALCKCTSTATAVGGSGDRMAASAARGAFASALAAGAHLKHAANIAASAASPRAGTVHIRLERSQTPVASDHAAIGTKLAAAYAAVYSTPASSGGSSSSGGGGNGGSGGGGGGTSGSGDGSGARPDSTLGFDRGLSCVVGAAQRGIANAAAASSAEGGGDLASSRVGRDTDPVMDWFAASAHMILRSQENSLTYLENMSRLPVAAGLWHCCSNARSSLNNAAAAVADVGAPRCILDAYGDPASLADTVERLVAAKLPAIANAFQVGGISIGAVVTLWSKQCFWNFLDWDGVVEYMTLCTVMDDGFQARYMMAVLAHLQPLILKHAPVGDLPEVMLTSPIRQFSVGDWLDFIAAA